MTNVIKTTVRLFATFKQITNQREIEFEMEEGATIQQLLEVLFNRYNTLRDKIFDDNYELRPWIHILKNGRNTKFLAGIETILADGDVIALFPPVAGG
ncbi:MAG: ubiquitin-like small modifier protein 1 [Candidatus Hodarchaeales archaeon]|jgi:MoaD family protein